MSTIDETIVSEFYTFYYFKAICGAIILLLANWYFGYLALSGGLTGSGYGYFALLLVLLGVYFYFFSKSWKRVIITPTEILIDDVVFKKQLTIPYTDIKAVGTYRAANNSSRNFRLYGKDFVMELNNGTSVAFSENYYNNYSKLTMAIYLHKYGPGHGRERYMERHGG
jgi:hypothetical protein